MIRTILLSLILIGSASADGLIDLGQVGLVNEVSTSNTKPFDSTKELSKAMSKIAQAADNSYKIKSKGLSLGEVQTKEVDNPDIVKPIALVGCDKYSVKWLHLREEKLKELKPVYYIINCDSKTDYKEFINATGLTKAMAIDGSGFNKVYGVIHYPVLLTKKYISQ
jgi:integrating conjugative element protein (TIGR03765 family)